MNTVNSQFSLRTFLLAGGSIAIVAIATFWFFIYTNLLHNILQTQVSAAATDLLNTSASQSQRLLPGLLIPEAADGNKLYLDSIIASESLINARVISPQEYLKLQCDTQSNGGWVCPHDDYLQATTIYPIRSNSIILGYLQKSKSLQTVNYLESLKSSFAAALLFSSIAIVAFVIFLLIVIEKHVRRPLEELDLRLLPVLEGSAKDIEFDGRFREMERIYSKLSRLISDYAIRRNEAMYAAVAQQVAHDIRSPLTALKMLAEHCPELSDQNRNLLRSASNRITGIADGLLTRSRKLNTSFDNKGINSETYQHKTVITKSLAHIAQTIIDQKRAEYYNRLRDSELQLVLDIKNSAIVEVNNTEIERVLSNLLNNAVEATDDSGKVRLTIQAIGKSAVITISDNGKGIPEDVRTNLGTKGFSFGKANGSGLGLYHAFKTVRESNGKMSVSSRVGVGTQITIQLPLVEVESDSNVLELDLTGYTALNVIDDDPTIHQSWKKLLKGRKTINSYFSPEDYTKAVTNEIGVLNLIDYDYGDSSINGLELITRLNHRDSILVSSQCEEPWLRKRCRMLGIKTISKSDLPNLQIRI